MFLRTSKTSQTPDPSIFYHIVKSSRVTVIVVVRQDIIAYFGVLLAGLTSEGDGEATGAGTAEKADFGKGMRC